MEEHRQYTSRVGLAKAEAKKSGGLQFDDLVKKYAKKKYGKDFSLLSQKEKNSVFYEIIEAAARDNPKVTIRVKRLQVVGKVTLVVTAVLATYEIMNADNKPKEAIKQGIGIAGGIAGGAAGGAMVSTICGPGAPFCAIATVTIGSIIGGIAGYLAAESLDDEIEEFTKWGIN